MTEELLAEAIRMRQVPGVLFVDGATGRRAVIAGTGLDVWEVIATWNELGKDDELLAQAYPWRSAVQLRSALGYYRLFPSDIDGRLDREAQ